MAELEAEDELAKAVLAPDDPGLELPAGNATVDNQDPIGFQAKDAEEPLPDIQTAERSLVELLSRAITQRLRPWFKISCTIVNSKQLPCSASAHFW